MINILYNNAYSIIKDSIIIFILPWVYLKQINIKRINDKLKELNCDYNYKILNIEKTNNKLDKKLNEINSEFNDKLLDIVKINSEFYNKLEESTVFMDALEQYTFEQFVDMVDNIFISTKIETI
jgi:hypothetical protein